LIWRTCYRNIQNTDINQILKLWTKNTVGVKS